MIASQKKDKYTNSEFLRVINKARNFGYVFSKDDLEILAKYTNVTGKDLKPFLNIVGSGIADYLIKKISNDPEKKLYIVETLGGFVYDGYNYRYPNILNHLVGFAKSTAIGLIAGPGVYEGLEYRFQRQEAGEATGIDDPTKSANRNTYLELQSILCGFVYHFRNYLGVDPLLLAHINNIEKFTSEFALSDSLHSDLKIRKLVESMELISPTYPGIFKNAKDEYKFFVHGLAFGLTALSDYLKNANEYNIFINDPQLKRKYYLKKFSLY